MSLLEDEEAAMEAACLSELGDTIRFRPEGAAAYLTILAYGDFEEVARALDGGRAIEQDIQVEVLIADVPVKPTGACRVQLAKVADTTFKPVNVGRNKSGTGWAFELAQVNG